MEKYDLPSFPVECIMHDLFFNEKFKVTLESMFSHDINVEG